MMKSPILKAKNEEFLSRMPVERKILKAKFGLEKVSMWISFTPMLHNTGKICSIPSIRKLSSQEFGWI